MPFIGNQPALSYTSFAVQHFTTSATTSYTLDYSVANENEIRLVINNVVQQPGSSYAYTASGTTLTLSAATSATDTMYAVFLGKAVQTVTPASGSVTNAMLGETITVANGGTGLTSGFANGITVADNWRLTTSFEAGASSKIYITSNLEQVDTTGQGTLGSAMTESSGVFTFPSTGIWYVGMLLYTYDGADYNYAYSEIDVTTDNSSYTEVAQAVGKGVTGASLREASSYVSTLIDVTDTANVKVKFGLTPSTTGVNVFGDTGRNGTSMMFIRVGDT